MLRGEADKAVETIRKLQNSVDVIRETGESTSNDTSNPVERNGHLLLVEDDRTRRDALAELLRANGFKVTTTTVDGKEA